GKSFEEITPEPTKGGYSNIPKSYYDPVERLKAMDQDGIDAEVLFPGLAGFGGGGFFGIKDPELRSALYRAYNDILAEDWRGTNPERFVAQTSLPLYDIEETVAEVRRAYDIGHRCVTFPSNPEGWGFPTLADAHWNPLWATMQDLDLPVSVHIGGGAPPPGAAAAAGAGASPIRTGSKGEGEAYIIKALSSNIATLAEFMFSGIMVRFPSLKFVSVESGIGWVPYFLEQCDDVYTRQRYWTKSELRMLPSEYAARQLHWNFWNEKAGLHLLDFIGEDHVMWESDFPHSICNWPNSWKVVDEITKGIQPATRQKILADNAAKLYKLN
ncbi:MAG: amidohydrolase family protein, partial [Dehalococcoidia bacterium]